MQVFIGLGAEEATSPTFDVDSASLIYYNAHSPSVQQMGAKDYDNPMAFVKPY